MSNFHSHFPNYSEREKVVCTHDDKSCTFNGTPMCRKCYDRSKAITDREWAAARAAAESCETCQEVARQKADEYANRRCAYCGAKASDEVDVSTHSGVYECGACWMWRKMDGPAARHWNKVAREFMSNIDMHDMMTFFPERIGLDMDESSALFAMARQIIDKTDAMISAHTHNPNHPDHPDNKE